MRSSSCTGRALQAADAHGRLLWGSLDFKGGDQPFGPSIADINGDGAPEILLAQRYAGPLRIIRGDGALIEEHELPGGMIGAPVVADVDGDGLLEVLTVAAVRTAPAC